MDELAKEYADKAIFLLVNTRGLGDAQTYREQKGLSNACIHAGNRPPAEYGLKYIPHKTIIDSSGKVVKNFDGVNLRSDLKGLLG